MIVSHYKWRILKDNKMENEIYEYLSKYIPITEELEEELSKIEFIKRFGNGTILLEEGKISNECFFIFTYFPKKESNPFIQKH